MFEYDIFVQTRFQGCLFVFSEDKSVMRHFVFPFSPFFFLLFLYVLRNGSREVVAVRSAISIILLQHKDRVRFTVNIDIAFYRRVAVLLSCLCSRQARRGAAALCQGSATGRQRLRQTGERQVYRVARGSAVVCSVFLVECTQSA